ncbi:MAG TPA: efflux transporter outer membrane subunit [Steroidobacteraceae bacterium]|nr:efflux transporter outer membrane subunit [Steroidobacteraceae bacterium]
MRHSRLIPLTAAVALLCACAVGPDYKPPANLPAGDWLNSADSAPVDLTWWQGLHDPLLEELIQAAVAHNLDLKAADAHLREARANREAIGGGAWPQVNLTGSATRNAWSENGPIPVQRVPGFQRYYNLFEAGFDASWEIDLWGHNRRAVEGATARAVAAEEARRETLMRVITEVARSYVDLRSAQQQGASVKADADAQADIAKLVAERLRTGEASRFDFLRADAQARSTRALLPDLDADAHAAVYRLALLSGQTPEALATRLLAPQVLPTSPALIATGLRSEVLRRRPDVRAAERQLAAATADVGVATAELFPRLSLVGSIGQQALTAQEFTSSNSTYFSVGPSLHWPIFAGGTLRANVRAADARADAAGASYEAAVLGALSDSESAVNRLAAAQQTRTERDLARRQSEEALALARQRYRAGEDDLIVLLQSQSAYSTAEQQSIAAQAAALTAMISLYKALGGGWQSFEAAPADVARR